MYFILSPGRYHFVTLTVAFVVSLADNDSSAAGFVVSTPISMPTPKLTPVARRELSGLQGWRWVRRKDTSTDSCQNLYQKDWISCLRTSPKDSKLWYSGGNDEAILVVDGGETVGEAEWIQRMLEYLASKENDIVRGKRVAMITSSLSTYPSSWSSYYHIGCLVSRICSDAKVLYFVVSTQEEQGVTNNNSFTHSNPSKEQQHFGCDSIEVIESLELEEVLTGTDADKEASIDVIVLSTTSQDVIHDDPFVNEFLRLTDAPIYMSSDCTDNFCYYSRLQEGADITLW